MKADTDPKAHPGGVIDGVISEVLLTRLRALISPHVYPRHGVWSFQRWCLVTFFAFFCMFMTRCCRSVYGLRVFPSHMQFHVVAFSLALLRETRAGVCILYLFGEAFAQLGCPCNR